MNIATATSLCRCGFERSLDGRLTTTDKKPPSRWLFILYLFSNWLNREMGGSRMLQLYPIFMLEKR